MYNDYLLDLDLDLDLLWRFGLLWRLDLLRGLFDLANNWDNGVLKSKASNSWIGGCEVEVLRSLIRLTNLCVVVLVGAYGTESE